MRDEYDVIVVGAGPGGSIAARTAAEECDVLLIEKRQEIGTPVRCAEMVDKERLSEFVQPDKKWIASEIHRYRANAPDGTTVEISGAVIGIETIYVLERKLFDREMAKRAAGAGADIMVRTRATGLVLEDGVVKGVKINRLGENFEVRAKVVIGADGVESQVGRWGGINTTLKLKDIESCAQYYMANVHGPEDIIDAYVGSVAPSGYAWSIPKGEKAANIGIAVLASKLNGKRPIDYLNEFVAKNFPDGQPAELVMGGVTASDALKTIAGNGFLVVGDAARCGDPVTGAGIISAMDSGKMSGEVARKAVRQNDASIKVLREYESRWHNTYGKLQKHNYKIKEFYANMSDDEFNKIIGEIKDMQFGEVNFMQATRVLKANPKLMLILRHLYHVLHGVQSRF
ncbi:MAG TPA: NAD(P)/FAD-dependent oxidoreductase [Candidatus Acidoferrales bacterium]|nr:NAD(P)/FAD-dependent oxidoreductase [Candidatus Acidoferrales bacterium]